MKSFTRNLFLAVCICVLIATADAAPTSGSVPQGLGRSGSLRRSGSVRRVTMTEAQFRTFQESGVLHIESPSPPPPPLDDRKSKSKFSGFRSAVKKIVHSLLPSKGQPKRASFYPSQPQAQNPPYSTTNAEPSARQSLPYPHPPAQNPRPAPLRAPQRFSFFPDPSRYSEIPEGSEYSNPNSSTEHLTASHANDDFGDEEEGGMAGATLVHNSRVPSQTNLPNK